MIKDDNGSQADADLLLRISNTPAHLLSESGVETAISVIASDPRTMRVSRTPNDNTGRPMLDIEIEDTIEGRLTGRYSVGRILNSMRSTQAQWAAMIDKKRAAREEGRLAHEKALRAEVEREQRNIAFLKRLNISVDRLARIRGRLIDGTYVDENDVAAYHTFAQFFCGGSWETSIEEILRTRDPRRACDD
jgi:hypothetical protein